MAKFVVKQITDLENLKEGDEIPESDYSHYTKSGKFIQFKYIKDEDKKTVTIVKPGIWSIQYINGEYSLLRTEFSNDQILKDFSNTKEIEKGVDDFFNGLHIYSLIGTDVPRRGGILWGPPGTGKSEGICQVSEKYVKDKKTAIIKWDTGSFDPDDVKNFVRSFVYQGVEKLIFIMEDLGGVEVGNVEVPSDPSLLALLDNKEKIFTIPVYILTTTNFPEIFASNLANRPGRFDDKIKVPYPTPEFRIKLFDFFLTNLKKLVKPSKEIYDLLESKKTDEFSPAHIKEIVVRSALHKKTPETVINEIFKEIELFKKAFDDKKGKFGFD